MLNASGGVKDQEYGLLMTPINVDILQDAGKAVTERAKLWKGRLGDDFHGFVPLNREWTRWGVRYLEANKTAALEIIKANATTGSGGGSAGALVAVAQKYIAARVPKSLSKEGFEKVLREHLGVGGGHPPPDEGRHIRVQGLQTRVHELHDWSR